MKRSIAEMMALTGVKFGTSGARGLADAMTDQVCHGYAKGFLQYLRTIGELRGSGSEVVVGGDFRPSTDRIMAAVFGAIRDMGCVPVNAGKVPSPAVALRGLERGIPAIMVTGSHIPDDRNGIKFNKATGEILKSDETGIMSEVVAWDDGVFDEQGRFRDPVVAPPVDDGVRHGYVRRYLDAFPGEPLTGSRLGVYQHSAVGRDVIVEILKGLGAEVTALGRSDRFVSVDTEAIRPEDVELAREWAAREPFDAIVSADGDSDRPLLSDAHGEWIRGDLTGVLCARFLKADSVVTPVSSNTVVEQCGWFREVRRTRIGSPYVVEAMADAEREGRLRVVGYEANGGFMIQTDLSPMGKPLGKLPTRDAMIVLIGVLLLARSEGKTVAQLVAALPARSTASDRLTDFAPERSRAILERFSGMDDRLAAQEIDGLFGELMGARTASINRTDGVRVTFANGEILHLRPSGNAPEFRCYAEAGNPERAVDVCARALLLIRRLA
ncbi:MAG: phosphomannomutase [Limisphaerales bacterium]